MIRGFIAASLDGYIADPQGSVTFLAPYEDEPAGYDSFIATVGTLVMGRRTFEACCDFADWPYLGKRTLVVSSTAPASLPPETEVWSLGVPALISHLRTRAEQDVWVVGGGQLQRAFLDAEALDRLDLFVVPVLLGTGIPLFPSSGHRQSLVLADLTRHGQLAHMVFERPA